MRLLSGLLSRFVQQGTLRVTDANGRFTFADVPAGGRLVLPDAPEVHLFVATGAIELAGVDFGTADAARVSGVRERVTVTEDSQLMAWAFD